MLHATEFNKDAAILMEEFCIYENSAIFLVLKKLIKMQFLFHEIAAFFMKTSNVLSDLQPESGQIPITTAALK